MEHTTRAHSTAELLTSKNKQKHVARAGKKNRWTNCTKKVKIYIPNVGLVLTRVQRQEVETLKSRQWHRKEANVNAVDMTNIPQRLIFTTWTEQRKDLGLDKCETGRLCESNRSWTNAFCFVQIATVN